MLSTYIYIIGHAGRVVKTGPPGGYRIVIDCGGEMTRRSGV